MKHGGTRQATGQRARCGRAGEHEDHSREDGDGPVDAVRFPPNPRTTRHRRVSATHGPATAPETAKHERSWSAPHALAGVGRSYPPRSSCPRFSRRPHPDRIPARRPGRDLSRVRRPVPAPCPPRRPHSRGCCVGCVAGRALQGTAQVPRLGFFRPRATSAPRGQAVACPENRTAKQACAPFRIRTDRPRLSEGQAVPDGRRPVIGIARVGRVHAGVRRR